MIADLVAMGEAEKYWLCYTDWHKELYEKKGVIAAVAIRMRLNFVDSFDQNTSKCEPKTT